MKELIVNIIPYQTYSLVGLIFDIIGVLVLIRYGLPPNEFRSAQYVEGEIPNEDKLKHQSKLAVWSIIVGFSLQFIGVLFSFNN